MDEKPEGSLSAAETAFFESGGNTPLETSTEATPPPAENQPSVEETTTDGSVSVRDEKGRFVKTIPFDVFHAEREEHKRTKAEMAELREFKGRMEERWQMLANAAAQQQAPPTEQDPEPDPNTDIFAHNAWLKRQLDKVTTGLSERDKSEKQAKEAAEYEGKVWTFWNQSAAAYKAENPEFDDAVKWMSETRTQQLKALSGLHPAFKTDKGIIDQINRELFDINVAAAQQGISPAQYIFDMAKQWGYQGKAAPLTLPPQLAKVADAQAASRTVGAAPGAATGAELTLEQIVGMPIAEFNAWHADPKNARRYEKLMGA